MFLKVFISPPKIFNCPELGSKLPKFELFRLGPPGFISSAPLPVVLYTVLVLLADMAVAEANAPNPLLIVVRSKVAKQLGSAILGV